MSVRDLAARLFLYGFALGLLYSPRVSYTVEFLTDQQGSYTMTQAIDLTPKGKFKAVLLYGPPGCGKGTQGAVLGQNDEFCHVSSGDIFRSLDKQSPAGQLFRQYADHGNLVPDDATMSIWYNYVCGLVATSKFFPEKQRLLIDGLPRTVDQVQLLEQYVDVERIVVLEIEDVNILVDRLTQRAAKEGRVDDSKVEVLKNRFEVYQKQTAPVLEHYSEDLVRRVNANQRPLEVLADVIRALY